MTSTVHSKHKRWARSIKICLMLLAHLYGAFEAQEMGKKHQADLDMTVVDYPNMVYVGDEQGNERGYTTEPDAKAKGLKPAKLSGTEFRKRLRSGEEIPEWFAFPSVVKTLRDGGDKIFL